MLFRSNTVTWTVSEAWLNELPIEHRHAIVESARESIAIAHGIAAHQAVLGWAVSCREFEACHVLDGAERARMRDVTRPAFKSWITEDFGIPAAEVEALWSEVERVGAELRSQSADTYLR